MFTLLKKKYHLQKWVDQFVEERGHNYQDHLYMFMEMYDKPITEITDEDIRSYAEAVDEMYTSTILRNNALRALNCFLRYWRARGHKYLNQMPTSWYN